MDHKHHFQSKRCHTMNALNSTKQQQFPSIDHDSQNIIEEGTKLHSQNLGTVLTCHPPQKKFPILSFRGQSNKTILPQYIRKINNQCPKQFPKQSSTTKMNKYLEHLESGGIKKKEEHNQFCERSHQKEQNIFTSKRQRKYQKICLLMKQLSQYTVRNSKKGQQARRETIIIKYAATIQLSGFLQRQCFKPYIFFFAKACLKLEKTKQNNQCSINTKIKQSKNQNSFKKICCGVFLRPQISNKRASIDSSKSIAYNKYLQGMERTQIRKSTIEIRLSQRNNRIQKMIRILANIVSSHYRTFKIQTYSPQVNSWNPIPFIFLQQESHSNLQQNMDDFTFNNLDELLIQKQQQNSNYSQSSNDQLKQNNIIHESKQAYLLYFKFIFLIKFIGIYLIFHGIRLVGKDIL